MITTPAEYTGYGPIINDTAGLARTFRQIGGSGTALWKQLAYGAHLQGDWNTVEHVTLLPGAGVGEHTHTRTEEIYYIISGEATMRMNGDLHRVGAGDLITTPIGGRHCIDNTGDQDMVFYVTEVFPGAGPAKDPLFVNMADRIEEVEGFRGCADSARVSSLPLTELFTGPWRAFSEIRLDPKSGLGEYTLPDRAEVIFVVSGHASITVEEQTYTGTAGLCVGLPAGATRHIRNTSETEELRIISTEVSVA
jgi:mannose-6-phosphate isomerase-like protein (cupin superfamily)